MLNNNDLKTLRLEAGWSQKRAAHECGVSVGWWRRREAGQVEVPKAYELYIRLKLKNTKNLDTVKAYYGAEELKALRASLGLSQAQLAKHLHVNRVTVVRWEKGSTTPSEVNISLINALTEQRG